MQSKNLSEAFQIWQELYPFIPLLFKEPNPAPIKYILNKMELLDSPEVRLPLTQISDGLKDKLNKALTI
jgi:4-hydroxy-tetrahydrodipicolinate synthase